MTDADGSLSVVESDEGPPPTIALREDAPATGRRRHAASAERYMVLACGSDDVIAVALETRVVARLRFAGHAEARWPVPFDVVEASRSKVSEPIDQAHPEAVTVTSAPRRIGSLGRRRARRLVKAVAAPPTRQLLGFPGPAAPYWEFRGMHPSVAVVAPAVGPVLFRRRIDDSAWIRFGWPGNDNWLPVEDERANLALRVSRRDRLSGRDLTDALGFRPAHLVVALSRPRQGHCYKTVVGILRKP